MVDPIKGSGDKIIINTKPRVKESAEKTKDGTFDKVLGDRNQAEGSGGTSAASRNKADANLAILNEQNLSRMQRLETLATQIRSNTYKMVDAEVLADRLLEIAFDKKTRDKFIKKFIGEEMEAAKSRGKPLSDLDLKKLVFLMKGSKDETFDDPELEALLKDFS